MERQDDRMKDDYQGFAPNPTKGAAPGPGQEVTPWTPSMESPFNGSRRLARHACACLWHGHA